MAIKRIKAGTATVTAGKSVAESLAEIARGTESYVDISVPPSTNHLFITRGRFRVKSPEYNAWIEVTIPILSRLVPPKPQPWKVIYTLVGGEGLNMSRDLANIEKPITDTMKKAGVISDDSLRAGLWEVILRYVDSTDGQPYVRVEIKS